MRFFLGIEQRMAEDEEVDVKEIQETQVDTHKFSKKTASRARDTQRQMKAKKKKLAKAQGREDASAGPLFPALEMLRDPQTIAEGLFRALRGGGEAFEVRLLRMNMTSRLIGVHRLHLLSFYRYLQRYLVSHQREVTQILAFLVQASHDLVPPDEVEPLVRAIANNFVAERCTEEVMAVGLNAIREVCAPAGCLAVAPSSAARSSTTPPLHLSPAPLLLPSPCPQTNR